MEQRSSSSAKIASNAPIDASVDITEQKLLRRKDFLEFG
jgi:hypothetical protein